VGPVVSLDGLERRKIPCSCWDTTRNHPLFKLVAINKESVILPIAGVVGWSNTVYSILLPCFVEQHFLYSSV